MKKVLISIGAVFVLVAGLLGVTKYTADAAPCAGTFSIGVGGVGGGNSEYIKNVTARVNYTALPFSFSIQEGANNLDKIYRDQRNLCPNQHVKVVGHSGGAAVTHVWVTQKAPTNTNVVLLADPKRPAGPGGPGVGAITGFLGYPLAGVDNFYNGVPVLSICNAGDGICNINGGPVGYFTGVHQQPRGAVVAQRDGLARSRPIGLQQVWEFRGQ